VTGECLRLELRDVITEVTKTRVLRVVERRRSGERRGVALRGRSIGLSPPKWLSRSGGLTEGCLAVACHRGGMVARDTQREYDDTSHGVQLPSAKSVQVIVMPAFHTDTIRPQGFPPSRRFDPTWTLWLCFAPHPPMGFRPSEPFPLSQPRRLSAPVALLPLNQQPLLREAAPAFLRFVRPSSSPNEDPKRLLVRHQKQTDDIIRTFSVSKPPR
jgi:hypothetical protein